MRWPATPPAEWSDPLGDLDIHDWLEARGEDLERDVLRFAGPQRVHLVNSDSGQFRLESDCRCGHKGRLRLHKINAHLMGGRIRIP